ncbi:RNase3 domain-containing protein [Xylariaceae sp. AK1471]|nr:RNase3 domain-containing protein [Xylariaceae sp. AK1471]
MNSSLQDATAPMTGYESSSSEDSSSPDPTPIPEGLSDHLPELDDATNATSVRVDSSVRENSTIDPIEEQIIIHARAYQIEMLEESLKQNIIVAMDTGSGKTQVAVLRIQAELEKRSNKIIWFLAPTIPLCEQQFRVLKSQIGAAQIKLLSGADNVDTWSDNRIWDDYLKNVRVVVSTYQILFDAISHAFVQLDRLSLIVFDEAHNCVGKHPGSKIMERYHMHKKNGISCPAILGLTASPIMRSRLDGIEKIEQTLDSICKTPTIHREELISAVKRPILSSVTIPNTTDCLPTDSMISLAKAFRSLDIYKDPYILHLQSEGSEKSFLKLQKALAKRETYVTKQMQSFCRKSAEIQRELGPWASDYFIYQSITRFLGSNDRDIAWFETWGATEKRYLANVLQKVEIKLPQLLEDTTTLDLSTKFVSLVQELQSTSDGARCIIFVREVATVAILAHMLSAMSSVRSRFRVGTVIGTSNYAGRKRDLGDLDQAKDTIHLEDFRTDKINLLIATSVAEEGIDIPACNLIICFNAPSNLKSFIQRRGRARMENSKFILLSEASSDQLHTWLALEDEMKKRYEDDTRTAHKLAKLEDLETNPTVAPLHIPSTGAQLDFDQAKSHLEHFCQKITYGQYIDYRPYYIAQQINSSTNRPPKFTAVVILPPSLPPAIRRVKSLGQWYSEKNAFKDAAFQAFKAVYEAGLVNDNLMPLVDDILQGVETRSSLMVVNDLWKPWPSVAELWRASSELVQRELLLKDSHKVIARFDASLPCLPRLPPFKVYWDAETTWTVEISENFNPIASCTLKEDQSAALIDLAYGYRWPVEDSAHIVHLQSTEDIKFRRHVGQRAAENGFLDPEFLVRNTEGHPHLFIEWLPSKPSPELVKHIEKKAKDEPVDIPWLALRKWPRRQDLLHPIREAPPEPDGRYPRALPVSRCTLDTVDRSKAYFGAIIPPIIHMLEIYLTAEKLCQTLLAKVAFSNVSLVLTAISSRAAGEATNYERLEFLGDSILKLLATLSVMIQYPDYPEGYLSALKDRIVSNSRLCRASVDKGLDRFILTKSYTGRKWRPLYIKDLLSTEPTPSAKREMSTKTLADVVESLIGAAFEDGGMPKALACLQIFLPEVEWHDLTEAYAILSRRRDITTKLPPTYEPLEELIGYTFQNKALLMEAITHASWNLSTSTEACMERLEFFGDSILDNIIVSALWPYEPELSNNQMHLLRTASVNADLLGFLVMEWCISQETTDISTDLTTVVNQTLVPFWKFMRHNSSQVSRAQQTMEKRHAAEREGIIDAMAHGTEYPWAQLAHLDTPKFFSDMFEGLLGAVWVDSGSIETCKEIVERIGILPYLRRMLTDNVEARHPKNKLGELAGRERKTVRYETEVRIRAGMKDLFCSVFVDEQFVVEVCAGVNLEEVVTKAADEAYHLLTHRANISGG